jgi:hypothetical protein
VKGVGDKLLAGAGLPAEEHGRVRLRDEGDAVQNLLEDGALAHDLVEPADTGDRLAQVDVLRLEARLQRADLGD